MVTTRDANVMRLCGMLVFWDGSQSAHALHSPVKICGAIITAPMHLQWKFRRCGGPHLQKRSELKGVLHLFLFCHPFPQTAR
jgi:hypothetical protein